MLRLALAALAGALSVFGYAPYGVALLPIASLALLFALWRGTPSFSRAVVPANALLMAAGFMLFGFQLAAFVRSQ